MEKKKSKFTVKALLQFVVLCAGATTIYMPVFCRSTYYDALVQGFNLSNTQFAALFSAYTLLSLITYFPGGVIADKFSPRKLLTISFISTGLLTFWQLTFPSYPIAIFIYAAQGVTTTLTFWAALIKATRQFGDTIGGESKALGSLEGGRGIFLVILGSVALLIFSKFAAASQVAGLKMVLGLYGVILVVCGIISWIVFNDKQLEEASVTKQSVVKLISECLKNPRVWVVALMVLGAYAMTSNLTGYASKIGTAKFSLPAATAALVPVVSMYVLVIGAFGGGWLGDKIGATKAMIVGVLGMIVSAILIIALPGNPAMNIPYIIVYCICAFFMGVLRGQFYAPLREANVPMYLSGTAVGLIAIIGYSSDLFLPIISGGILDAAEPVSAFKSILFILVAFGCFSILMSFIMLKLSKKNKAES